MEKWPFLDQNHGLNTLKNVNFSTFWTSCFYSLETRFFVLEYRKRHIPGLYCLRRNVGKMATFGPTPWINPFGKRSIFSSFWTSCFYNLERRFCRSRISYKRFPWPIFGKKTVGKMAIFGPKAWVNPFGKMSISRLFQFLVFIA